jgi:hypothetical protein
MRIFDMLFRKRKKSPSSFSASYQGFSAPVSGNQETYLIEYEQMVKGAIVTRGRKKVRQCAVMVGSDIRLVTSGDTVSKDTYLAMQKSGYLADGNNDDNEAAPSVDSQTDTVTEEEKMASSDQKADLSNDTSLRESHSEIEPEDSDGDTKLPH